MVNRNDIPQAGDIVVFTYSHCGIIADANHAIEGNSNNNGSRDGFEVVLHPHPTWSQVRAFIRLPILKGAAA